MFTEGEADFLVRVHTWLCSQVKVCATFTFRTLSWNSSDNKSEHLQLHCTHTAVLFRNAAPRTSRNTLSSAFKWHLDPHTHTH